MFVQQSFFSGAVEDDRSVFDQADSVSEVHHLIDVLLYQKNGQPIGIDLIDLVKYFISENGGQPKGWLIDRQQLGAGHDAPAKG